MNSRPAAHTPHSIAGQTPALRVIDLLELIASKDAFVSLPELVEETGLTKPTVHRMLQQLENGQLLVRQSDGRHYGTGARARQLAENLLLNSTQHGARQAVLRSLVSELGESCNLTALSGNDVVYLERVETHEPLRFHLHAGSRVPAHCSASGKMIMSQLSGSQRHKLLSHAPLPRHTDRTMTDVGELDAELDQVARMGYAIDHEEFMPGLVCVAVLVPPAATHSNLCVAVQAPSMRFATEASTDLLAALTRAAAQIRRIEDEGAAESW